MVWRYLPDSRAVAAESGDAVDVAPGTAAEPVLGLRERKKARTKAAIQEHALRLFREQGYAETTVEQIAAAAEVSPSTFFRYFPAKEDTVLTDLMDQQTFEVMVERAGRAQPDGGAPVCGGRGLPGHVRRAPPARDGPQRA